jgi:hypothetical protein
MQEGGQFRGPLPPVSKFLRLKEKIKAKFKYFVYNF